MEDYLKEFYQEDIVNLLNDIDDCLHVSINLNLSQLKARKGDLYLALLRNVHNASLQWNKALLEVQKDLLESSHVFLEPGFQIKENCHVRFVNLYQSDGFLKGSFPNNDHLGLLVQVKGSIVRMTKSRLLEYKREYVCDKCKMDFILEAKYEKMYVFEVPRSCPNSLGTCKGALRPKSTQPKPEFCMDYQEIKIQELFTDKNVPASLVVTLDNDLVDICQPGECVTICGTIERRWRPFSAGRRSEVGISMRAYGLCKEEQKVNFNKDYSEQLLCIRAQWQDSIDRMGLLPARDIIVRSICPDIHGMYLVKLAIALSLCSGVELSYQSSETRTRGHSHLLLVGDPGLAKSKLLKAASKISLRSVHTTGFGCSAAGLTAAAIKEGGEWQLEAGALVLADGGVCCIDEFNLMRENDKASIHEAMEQQTISMAKAGLVCKLSTRCVLLAATNLKGGNPITKFEGPTAIDLGIGSPLLSRFDVVLILRDEREHDWDVRVCDHILNFEKFIEDSKDLWDLERLQTHFLAVHEIKPKISTEASTILAAYYQFCRFDPYRDPSRTTVRLLDSLHRLAQAHAKLTFRDNVEGIDALIIIRLLEFSWGFGRLLNSRNILKEDIPLGPNEEEICDMLRNLNLTRLEEDILDQKRKYNKSFRGVKIVQSVSEKRPFGITDLEKRFGFHNRPKKIIKLNNNIENKKETNSAENENIEVNLENYNKSDACLQKEFSGLKQVLKPDSNVDFNGKASNLDFKDKTKRSNKRKTASVSSRSSPSPQKNPRKCPNVFAHDPKPGPSKLIPEKPNADLVTKQEDFNFDLSSDEDIETYFHKNNDKEHKINNAKSENILKNTKNFPTLDNCVSSEKSAKHRTNLSSTVLTKNNHDHITVDNSKMDFDHHDAHTNLEDISKENNNKKSKETQIALIEKQDKSEITISLKDKENQLSLNILSKNNNNSNVNVFSKKFSTFGVLDFDDDDLNLDVALNISTQSNIRLSDSSECLRENKTNRSNSQVLGTDEGEIDEFGIKLGELVEITAQTPEDNTNKPTVFKKDLKINSKQLNTQMQKCDSLNINDRNNRDQLPTTSAANFIQLPENNKKKPNAGQLNAKLPKEKLNSIFNTPTPTTNALGADNRSSCHIWASQGDDLDCLDFEI